MLDAGYGIRDAGYGMRDTRYGIWDKFLLTDASAKERHDT